MLIHGVRTSGQRSADSLNYADCGPQVVDYQAADSLWTAMGCESKMAGEVNFVAKILNYKSMVDNLAGFWAIKTELRC